MSVDRRQLLLSGCAAVALAALDTRAARAGDLSFDPWEPGLRRAPRFSCPHPHCRHSRPDPDAAPGVGICSLALEGTIAYPDEVLP